MSGRCQRHWWLGAGIGLLLWLVMGRAVFGAYVVYDAAKFLADYGWVGESSFGAVMLGGGRWVYAVLADWGYGLLVWPSQLWVLRGVAVLGLWVLGWVLAAQFVAAGWRVWWAGLAVGLAVVNPGTAVWGWWSACFAFSWGAVLAVYGQRWVAIAGVGRKDWGRWLGGQALLQIAFGIYQPAALMGVVGLVGVGSLRRLTGLAGMVLGLAAHWAVARGLAGWVGEGGEAAAERVAGLGALWGQALQAVVHIGPKLLAGWGGLLEGGLGAGLGLASGAVLGVGVVLWLALEGQDERGWRRVAAVASGVGLLGMGLLPSVVSADGYAPYRLLAPGYAVVAVLGMAGWGRLCAGGRWQRGLGAGGVLFACVHFGLAFWVVEAGVRAPREREAAVLRAAVAAHGLEAGGLTVIGLPSGTGAGTGVRAVAEYGYYELSQLGFAEAYVAMVALDAAGWRREQLRGRHPLDAVDVRVYAAGTGSVPPGYPLVDVAAGVGLAAGGVGLSEGVPVTHPRFGAVTYYAPDVYVVPGFGEVRAYAGNWARHKTLGWLVWLSAEDAPVQRYRLLGGEEGEVEVEVD